MRFPSVHLLLIASLAAACANQSAIKPAEMLDERTGVTVGALQTPIELVENDPKSVIGEGKRTSFAYLGPLEWDNGGEITYGLWIHVAPGTDPQIGNLHAEGAVTMTLDDGPVALTIAPPPNKGSGPYRPVASWGQTAQFGLDVSLLKRMATSEKLILRFRGADQPAVEFVPTRPTRDTLRKFTLARGITDD